MAYQRLTQRDIIQEGDEYYASFGAWMPIETEFIGKRKGEVFSHYLKMRRHLTSRSSRAAGIEAESNDEGYKELFGILANGRDEKLPPA